MGRELKLKTNVNAPNSQYPYGRIRDDDGSSNGTPVNELVYGDIIQFFARMFEKAKADYPTFDYNDLPDDAYNGFQYFEALLKTRPYKVYTAKITQSGTGAPTVVIMNDSNTIGSIVWTRIGTGEYLGTLTGAFPALRTWAMISGTDGATSATTAFFRIQSDDFIKIFTFDAMTGNAQDGNLTDTAIEIRVYPS